MRRLLVTLIVVNLIFITAMAARADELEDITKQLNTLKTDLKNKEADHSKLTLRLEGIRGRVNFLGLEIRKKEQEVVRGEKVLDHQRSLLNRRVFSFYKRIKKSEISFLNLLIAENFSKSLQGYFFQQTVMDEDKRTILKIVRYIVDLEEKKKSLQRENIQLSALREEIDAQAKVLGADISATRQKVAQLSERQQSLVAAKLASIAVPRSAETSLRGCSSDLTNGKNPGFSPRLGFFSFGAPHGNGLNQYGAFGRAKADQNAETMLQEYYPGTTLKKDYDVNTTINVEGYGPFTLEEYAKRIYEMPNSWGDQGGMEALKAQAVAARSYGLVRKGGICTTEACQVFRPDPKGGKWEEAVNATAGWVLVDGGGNPVSTQYASTHGGYIKNLGKFDGFGGNPSNFSELKERAYDRESPWFHCDWGARPEYDGTAWLKTSEVADIANVIMLAQRDSGTSVHLSQTDKGIPDTWDAEKVKSELRNRGGSPFNNVSSVSVGADFGSGVTGSVTVNGDGGSVTFGGSEWKDWFNLRAPANIQIKSRLYNVET